jgi:hypothetical protein
MAGVIDMRLMRYINLFSKISKVSTTNCSFTTTNNFCRPKRKSFSGYRKRCYQRKKAWDILGKKIKIVVMPDKENREESQNSLKMLSSQLSSIRLK